MSNEPVILINLLKVEPAKQSALIALLKENTDAVIRTLDGWKTTQLIAAKDGASVVLYPERDTPAAVEAMRDDPGMKAYRPTPMDPAGLDPTPGPAGHHAQQTAARVMILDVGLEVIIQSVNAGGQQCDLDFRGAGVALRTLVIGDDLRLFCNRNGHVHSFFARSTLGKRAIIACKAPVSRSAGDV